MVQQALSNTKSGTDTTLVTHSYLAGNGNLSKSTYGNGQFLEYSQDAYDRIIEQRVSNNSGQPAVKTTSYTYNIMGQLARVTDHKNGGIAEFGYDTAGRVSSYVSPLGSVTYGYDSADRTNKSTTTIAGESYTTTYGYAAGGRMGNVDLPDGSRITRAYDMLNRETIHDLNPKPGSDPLLRSEIKYKDISGNHTTPLVSSYNN